MFKRLAYVGALGGLCVMLLVNGGSVQATQSNLDVIPGQYIVTFDDSVSEPGLMAQRMSTKIDVEPEHVYSHAFKGFSAELSDAAVERLQSLPEVVSIMPDQTVSIAAQTLPGGIDRVDADLSATANIDGVDEGVDVDIAILDTGIDLDHPDLNVVGGISCVGGSADDGNGHGTHVAGTAAAVDNDFGVVGVAPGARLWAVKVLGDNGSGSLSSVLCGIDWVTQNADTVDVVNMSLGGFGSEPFGSGCTTGDSYHDSICNSVASGVTYVVAAGNSSTDAASAVPAAYDEVITVSALNEPSNVLASFSNYGADVDIIAPGVSILSTVPGGGYSNLSGTSMASPHVAGAAALYLANNPGASPSTVQSVLESTGTFDWNNSGDPDGVQEPLLNVASF
ncbi:MAG: peptidase S8 [Chloroflexi bacterium AL-W]|nr:peptidase S8 [Chloroflexi bacterium AL-N1]NOK65234.1 peptidase S8 [Chloroflexi bacterium AL-N10]NOK72501.1 peptidase S8 [Chloroflexi bacterium AL-N5]NOK79413.1 peptidase S8 [Chloroflexi bacterium AL-W]NOK87329.1 peptidase S8 [Chloroflexi bacterium AL-N15]